MALPTFAGAGAIAGSTTTSTPALPTGWAVDDILLLFVETANQPITAPAGWTQVGSTQGTGTAGGTAATALQIFWQRATALTQAPTLIDAGDHTVSVICGFRGCPTTGDPWDVTSGGIEATADTSVSIPGSTTTVGDCLIVAACSSQVDSASARFSVWACAGALHEIERVDGGNIAGNGGGLGVCTFEKYAPGAYGPVTATSDTTTKGMMTIALKGATVDRGPYGTYVLDSFSTNDTSSPLINWSSGAGDTTAPPAGLHASAGSAFRSSSSAYRQGEHWPASTFGGPGQAQEAWVEFDALASGQEFAIKMATTSPAGNTGNDYGIYFDWSGGGPDIAVTVTRRNGSSFTSIVPNDWRAWSAGDCLGCAIIPVGSTARVEIWRKPAGGSWTKITEGTDSAPLTAVGYLGLQFAGGQGFKTRHFGGGNFTLSTTTNISVPVAMEFSVALSRQIGLRPLVALTLVPTISRQIGKSITVPLTLVPTLSRSIARKIELALNMVPTVLRQITRPIAVALTLTPTVTVARAFARSISVALALTPTVSRQITRNIALPLTLVPTVTRRVGRAVSTALTFTVSVSRRVGRSVTLPLTLVPTVTTARRLLRSIAVPLTLTPTVTRTVGRNIASALSFAVSTTATFVPAVGGAVLQRLRSLRGVGH